MLSIHDFFKKHGLEDGDNAKLLKQARWMRPKIAELLNKEFQRRSLPYVAVEIDYGTARSPVRVELWWQEEGRKKEWDMDTRWDQYGGNPMMKYPAGVRIVLRTVQKRLKSG
jgi:hypothetical protein